METVIFLFHLLRPLGNTSMHGLHYAVQYQLMKPFYLRKGKCLVHDSNRAKVILNGQVLL